MKVISGKIELKYEYFSSFGGYEAQLNKKTDSFKHYGGKKALEGMQTIHKVYQYGSRP